MIRTDKQTKLKYEHDTYIVSECKCKNAGVYSYAAYLPCGFGHDERGCYQHSYAGYHLQDVQDGTIKEQWELMDNELLEDE